MRGRIVNRNKDKKGKANYAIVISSGKDSTTGKYKQEWIAVQGGKTEAESKLAEIIRQKDTGSYIKPGKLTFGELLDRWLSDYVKTNLSPSTYDGYEYIVRVHLKPALGEIPLTQLKSGHIDKYYSDKLKTKCLNRQGLINPGTIEHHHMAIHGALKRAIKWGLLMHNPADGTEPPRTKQPDIQVMNEDDISKFLEAAKQTDYYALFYTALYTGMRRSEILALRWSDTDLLRCQVSVVRSLCQQKDKSFVFRPPKTLKGRRSIPLTPSNALVLEKYREEQIARRIVLGTTLKEDDLVFCDVNGNPLCPDNISNAWVDLAKRVGLKGIHLHTARHSMASIMLKMGIHPAIVQQRLGHASIQITIDTYSHILPGLQEAAALAFDKGLHRSPERESIKSN